MQLMLNHTQRLNLHALMGAQRASVDELRIWWRLQDRIELSLEEKVSIEFKVKTVETVNGPVEQPHWRIDKAMELRPFDFAEEEFRRLEKLVKEWQPGFLTTSDRGWLEPLLAQFSGSVNGHLPQLRQ
jgi:hypothetical protein